VGTLQGYAQNVLELKYIEFSSNQIPLINQYQKQQTRIDTIFYSFQ